MSNNNIFLLLSQIFHTKHKAILSLVDSHQEENTYISPFSISLSLLLVDRTGFETLIPPAICNRRVWTHSTPSVSVIELDLVMQSRVRNLVYNLREAFAVLSTDDRLRSWNLNVDVSCGFCSEPLETRKHLFFEYSYSMEIWEALVRGVMRSLYTTDWDNLIGLLSNDPTWDSLNIALTEEVKINTSNVTLTPTLLGLTSSLSSLCSGAEYLLQVVRGAIPQAYFDSSSTISAAEVAVQLLDYLYEKLDQVCLIQGGEYLYQELLMILLDSCFLQPNSRSP
ncbi:unnamed protein product [Brassica napus]|uniref:(rape) hypothetical protein n=1 Tax=Brassica napus TaxID=3708 RepID=A0A816QI20_BRANA|nr:unnamed protein product [Brassica napus]